MKHLRWSIACLHFLPSLTRVREVFYLLLAGVVLWVGTTASNAQSVVFSGSQSSLNAGKANLCGPNQNAGPCFLPFSLSYKVTASGTLGQPKVLTQGSPDLDFTLAVTGSTCEGLVTAGTTCTVAVRFTPKYPGVRPGGVLVVDSTGKTLATTLIYGEGVGAQIGFVPGTTTTVNVKIPGTGTPVTNGIAVDGAGDVYAINDGQGVFGVVKVTPGGTKTLLKGISTNSLLQALALDGAGDLFLAGEIVTDGKDSRWRNFLRAAVNG